MFRLNGLTPAYLSFSVLFEEHSKRSGWQLQQQCNAIFTPTLQVYYQRGILLVVRVRVRFRHSFTEVRVRYSFTEVRVRYSFTEVRVRYSSLLRLGLGQRLGLEVRVRYKSTEVRVREKVRFRCRVREVMFRYGRPVCACVLAVRCRMERVPRRDPLHVHFCFLSLLLGVSSTGRRTRK